MCEKKQNLKAAITKLHFQTTCHSVLPLKIWNLSLRNQIRDRKWTQKRVKFKALQITMVYSQSLLARRGPLGAVWVAAYCFKKLKKTQITDTDILASIGKFLFLFKFQYFDMSFENKREKSLRKIKSLTWVRFWERVWLCLLLIYLWLCLIPQSPNRGLLCVFVLLIWASANLFLIENSMLFSWHFLVESYLTLKCCKLVMLILLGRGDCFVFMDIPDLVAWFFCFALIFK